MAACCTVPHSPAAVQRKNSEPVTDTDDLFNWVSYYKPEAKVLEQHPTPRHIWMYSQGQAGHSSNLSIQQPGGYQLEGA